MLRNGGPMDSRQHLWLAAACFLGALLGWGAAKFRGNEEPERWRRELGVVLPVDSGKGSEASAVDAAYCYLLGRMRMRYPKSVFVLPMKHRRIAERYRARGYRVLVSGGHEVSANGREMMLAVTQAHGVYGVDSGQEDRHDRLGLWRCEWERDRGTGAGVGGSIWVLYDRLGRKWRCVYFTEDWFE